MKYVEHVKSVALALLVLLSVVLTFTIWTFKPSFDTIEPTRAVDVSIGENRRAEEVVQPHKALFHYSDAVTGTTESDHLGRLLQVVENWEIHNLTLVGEEVPLDILTAHMHSSNRVVLYYNGSIPFPVFDTVMEISDDTIPEAVFNRLVIEWGSLENNEFRLHFIDTRSGRLYQATVPASVLNDFQTGIVAEGMDFETYATAEGIGEFPVYVPAEEREETVYTYLLDEVSSGRFVNALFENPGNVSSTRDVLNEEYTDDSAIMRVYHNTKSISYVQPQAETSDPSIPSELVFNTLDFINAHGGWTDDYRYFSMNPLNQQITYQMFINNKPVFGSMLSSSIDITWGADSGEEQVYQYERPIYILESNVRTQTADMPAGEAVLSGLNRAEEIDLSAITDIIQAYEVIRKDQLIEFQPAWYYQSNGNWIKLSREEIGGGPLGLE